jgi:hypothetical protein
MENDVILGVRYLLLWINSMTLLRCRSIFFRLKSHDHLNVLRVCKLNTQLFLYSIG